LPIFFTESAQLHSDKTDETNFGGFGTIRMGCFPVLKIPITPDEPNVLDADDVLQGLGTDGWRRVRRVRRVVVVKFIAVKLHYPEKNTLTCHPSQTRFRTIT